MSPAFLLAAALAGDPSHFVTGAGTVVFPIDSTTRDRSSLGLELE